jgi:lipopolysaccharide/colanic/teichoic acid biosynthesis glycosyltransferase
MRAFLIATQEWLDKHPGKKEQSPPLLPLVDRPFVQHVVEYLARLGITRIDIAVCACPEAYSDLLGDGSRWGICCRCHLVKDPDRPYHLLHLLGIAETDIILMAHANRLPRLPLPFLEKNTIYPLLYDRVSNDDSRSESAWTGWGWIPALYFRNIPSDAGEAELYAVLASDSQCRHIAVSALLSVQSYADVMNAHMAVIAGKAPELLLTGREIEPGIWISRNVRLHPYARIEPPVYIGKNCSISEKVVLGPGTVVCDNCVIDRGSVIRSSVIFEGSYVGEYLDITDAIVDRNRLINVRLGAETVVREDFILGRVTHSSGLSWWRRGLSRAIAALILLVTWPVILLTAAYLKLIRSGPVLTGKDVLRLPSEPEEDFWETFTLYNFLPPPLVADTQRDLSSTTLSQASATWRDFFLRFLPELVNVIQGELFFTGVKPLGMNVVRSMPHDWQLLYLGAKPGIVSEVMVNFGPSPSPDECYSAEAFYSVSSGFFYDIKLLLKYFAQVAGILPRP